MTMSVRFCLSYDSFKWGFITLKGDIISTENIMRLRASNQVLCNVWSYDFYDITLSTE